MPNLYGNQLLDDDQIYLKLTDTTPLNSSTFTSVAGQSVFAFDYVRGLVDVKLNGKRLKRSEYTATDGVTVTLSAPIPSNSDTLVIYGYMLEGSQNAAGNFLSYGGTANAITLTSNNAQPAKSYKDGAQYKFRATASNTGAATISVDGLPAKACKTITGAALPSGHIRTDMQSVATYYAAGDSFVVVSDVGALADTNNAGAVTLSTDPQAIAGTPGVIPDAEQVRKNHVAQAATIADLRALEPAFDGQQVELLGHTVKGIGGGVFYHDAASAATDDNGVTVVTPGGKRWVRKLDGLVTLEMLGSDGTALADSQAVQSFADSEYLRVQMIAGKTYTLDASVADLSGMQDKQFFGNRCTIRVTNGDLPIKSPQNVLFDKIKFVGDRTGRQRVWVSNYNGVTFNDCSFRSFCNATLDADTYALMMYAGDTTDTLTTAGDSTGGRIVNCDFDGERITMFGVRIYTEFGVIGTATNTDTWVIGGNYDQYMWNAVEIAGPNTIGCGVTGWATAYNNALAPFDIDKGAKNCTVENVIIDKITGQPAPYGNSSRPSVVNIQGYAPTGLYSSGNTVRNVIATLYKSDLDAVINQGSAIATMAWSSGDDKIENVQVEVVGGQPVSAVTGKMGLAMLVFQDIGGCTVSEIRTNRASHGIVESGTTDAGGSDRKNYFSGFSSVNQIEGEAVCIAEDSADKRQFIISGIDLYSTKTATRKANGTVLNFQATNANTYIDISDSNIGVNSGFIVTALAPKLGFRDVFVRNVTDGQDKMFQSVNELSWLNLSGVVYNSTQLYCDTALAALSGPYTISTQTIHSEFDRFEKVNGSDLWVLSASPANPVIENWPIAQRLRKQNFTTSSGYEFVAFGATWRSVGDLLP